jgi:hypothetical protein
MKTILSKILFKLGDATSHLMLKPRMGKLYFVYNWLMTKSAELDTKGKVWKHEPTNNP